MADISNEITIALLDETIWLVQALIPPSICHFSSVWLLDVINWTN